MRNLRCVRYGATAVMVVAVAFSGVAGGVSAIAPKAVAPVAVIPATDTPLLTVSRTIARALLAQAAQAGEIVTVDVDSLVVRSDPTLSGAVVGYLSLGEAATVIDGPVEADGYEWFLLQQGGGTIGWSVQGFVFTGTTGISGLPAAPAAPVAQGGSFTIQLGGTVAVNVDSLVVRAGPSLGNAQVGSLFLGANAFVVDGPVVADGYEWFLLQQGGVTIGWSVQGFLQIAAPPAVIPETTSLVPPAQTVFTVTSGFFDVRSEPDASAGVARIVTVGTQLTQTGDPVEEDGITWFPVDGRGWVGGSTGGESGGLFLELYPLFVTADVLNVRSEPSLSGTVVQTLNLGETVNAFDSVRDDEGIAWSAVNEEGTLWVAAEYLTIQLDETGVTDEAGA